MGFFFDFVSLLFFASFVLASVLFGESSLCEGVLFGFAADTDAMNAVLFVVKEELESFGFAPALDIFG